MKRRVTLKQIAERTGLATSTISRALSANHQIPEDTRLKVRAIAEQMGYRPDPLISAFASRNRGRSVGDLTTIAYVTNFATEYDWRKNIFYRNAFDSAFRRADELGYKLEHF